MIENLSLLDQEMTTAEPQDFTPRAKVIEMSLREALNGDRYIGTEHLLGTLESDSIAVKLLIIWSKPSKIYEDIMSMLEKVIKIKTETLWVAWKKS